MTYEEIQKPQQDPSQNKINSRNTNNNKSNIAPEKKPLLALSIGLTFEGLSVPSNIDYRIIFSSQGISYIAINSLTDFKVMNEFASIFTIYERDVKKVVKIM